MKKKRIVNRQLLDDQHNKPCIACGWPASDPAHIKTRGSGGDDTLDNIIPLCRGCHIKQHAIGWFAFTNRYPKVKSELFNRGWQIIKEFGVYKLRRI